MVVVDASCLKQADSQPKSCGLVWGSAAAWRCSTFTRWTERTLAMTWSWWQHYKIISSWLLLLLLLLTHNCDCLALVKIMSIIRIPQHPKIQMPQYCWLRLSRGILLMVVNLHASTACSVVCCQDRSSESKSHPRSRVWVETSVDLLRRARDFIREVCRRVCSFSSVNIRGTKPAHTVL